MIGTVKYFACLGSLLLLLSACDPKRVLDHNTAIEGHNWNRLKSVKESVTITEPKEKHNFYVNIRNTNEYPYSNLYLFINTKFPNGKLSHDTIECTLADPNGKWLGKSSGDISDHRILIKQNVLFPEAGKYDFEIEHAMRVESIKGITDVGLRIEKAE